MSIAALGPDGTDAVTEVNRFPETPCTCAALRRSARRLTQAYDRALKPSGLRLTQYQVLAMVADTRGLTITELAALLAVDRTTLTRNLRPLEEAGLIAVGPGTDQRSRAVAITTQGRRRFKQAVPLWREAERSFRTRMGREEAAALRRLLDDAAASVPL